MLGFNCMIAGWQIRVYIFLKTVDKEHTLNDVIYQIDGSRGFTGNIEYKMTMNPNGTWKRNCKLILSEPFEKIVYPGDNRDKVKKITKINIPLETARQIQTFLSEEYLSKNVICKS